MDQNYQSEISASRYVEFLNSKNGRVQKLVLENSILPRLPKNTQAQILDAACGSGWLTKTLANKFPLAQGCDNSQELLKIAKKEFRGIEFKTADLTTPLPYPEDFFDSVILNMAGPDIGNLYEMFNNIFSITKPTGQLILTLPNPYYTFPVGVWKRSLLDFLLLRKPKLCIRKNYSESKSINREFNKNNKIESNFYPLSEYIKKARKAGYTLVDMEELHSKTDSTEFGLEYQLYRYPLLLLLEFAKPNH